MHLYARRVREVHIAYWGYANSTNRWERFVEKVELFFVCVFQEKYVQLLWDIERVVHPLEVATTEE
jgi:hypothetical protein